MSSKEGITSQEQQLDPAKLDPVKVAEAYYLRAIKLLDAKSWLDGLIDLQLAEEHLIGRYAPRYHPIDIEKYPMHRNFTFSNQASANCS